jgi:anti-sigma regulatory factor (Ser/Thr protein kinase)
MESRGTAGLSRSWRSHDVHRRSRLRPDPAQRTRPHPGRARLDAGCVAAWNVASDPIAVAQTRKDVSERLSEWGLADLIYATELIVSELVTNAIRYGAPPITLRLIQDRTLICEVSDSSNTAPHLRRARIFDEGGRGLMLVAQIAQHWGTRHTPTGKTIWAEQDLVPPE